MKRLEQKDTLENIANDLKSLSNIVTFMGIGCKDFCIESKEMLFISDCLEKIVTSLKEVEESLQVKWGEFKGFTMKEIQEGVINNNLS